jgi:biotin transport system substrate-specific component
MAATAATRQLSLVENVLPSQGIARYAGYAFFAIVGTLLLWASAKVTVPFFPVPMTLQTIAVLAIAGVYGLRLGLATILLYMAEGAIGLPVFASGAGLAYMAGPTGGFLAGFVVQTIIVGWAVDRGMGKNLITLFGVMLLSEVVLFAMGFGWLQSIIGAEKAWAFGVAPFLIGDALKTAIAAGLVFTGATKLPSAE